MGVVVVCGDVGFVLVCGGLNSEGSVAVVVSDNW